MGIPRLGNFTGFQSAPLTDVRGDLQCQEQQPLLLEFQSAPLTDVRGDPYVAVQAARDFDDSFNPLPSLM